MLFALENLPYWIFLGTGFLMFGLVILTGGGDDDAGLDSDFDADLDADLDVDADAEAPISLDTDAEIDASGGGWNPLQILGWVGVGKAPLVLLLALDLCLWGFLGWLLNVMLGGIFGRIPSGFAGSIVLVSSMVAALATGGQIARPIGKVFASFGEDTSGDRLIGCVGTVGSAQLHRVSEGKIAQVDVLDPAKNLITVNAALPAWATEVPKHGDRVLIIDRADQTYLYFVVATDSPDQEHWLNSRSQAQ